MVCRACPLFLIGISFWVSPLVGTQTRADVSSTMPRAGAPRVLRFVDERNRALEGSLFDAHPTRGGEVLFTREWAGTRNVWRASPDSRDRSRFPVWRAQPLTNFQAPQWAARPVAVAGGAIIFASNAWNQSVSTLASADVARLARLDERTQTATPLQREFVALNDLSASPNGRQVVFTSSINDQPALWKLAFNARGEAKGEAQLVTRTARRATWLDNSTLLYENIEPNPKSRGLYRLSTNARTPQLVMSGGGEAGALSGGAGLVFSARSNLDVPPQLYLMARDGSGLRALGGTSGARRPGASSDGKSLWFDAPQSEDNSRRALWILPLQADDTLPLAPFPVPDLNASSAPVPAEKPRRRAPIASDLVARLTEVKVVNAPDENGNSLSVIGTLSGANRSSVRLEAGAGQSPSRWTRITAANSPVTNGRIARWTPPADARGVWTLRLSVDNGQSAAQSLLRVELPLRAERPLRVESPRRAGAQTSPSPPVFPNFAATPVQPRFNSTPIAQLPPPPSTNEAPFRTATRSSTPFDVSGVPASMAPGQSARITFVSNSPVDPDVRLVARWVDFTLGTRHKWNLFYLPARRPISLVAPARSGQYKLIFALMRVDESGNIAAPAYNAPQQAWNGELASIAFAVEVGNRGGAR